MKNNKSDHPRGAVIIGGGPAGLIAAEHLSKAGVIVDLYERNPSVGRKFLIAGKSGLNLTKNEPIDEFVTHYAMAKDRILPALIEFGPVQVREWARTHNTDTFIGSSGKIFPSNMKASTLLHTWKADLVNNGVRLHTGWRWIDLDISRNLLQFQNGENIHEVIYHTVLFALGGASWPITGSTGEWFEIFKRKGFSISDLKPANMGFNVDWSEYLTAKFQGKPIKTVTLSYKTRNGQVRSQIGEFVISRYGLEGSLIYSHSSELRNLIEERGNAQIFIDLLPDLEFEYILHKLRTRPPKRSLSSILERLFSLSKQKIGLLWEVNSGLNQYNDQYLTEALKSLPLNLTSTRPISEAISTAGGIQFGQLDDHFMSKDHPGIFFAGEMLDWEAPTGGYLLNAVMATGLHAARGIYNFLQRDQ